MPRSAFALKSSHPVPKWPGVFVANGDSYVTGPGSHHGSASPLSHVGGKWHSWGPGCAWESGAYLPATFGESPQWPLPI